MQKHSKFGKLRTRLQKARLSESIAQFCIICIYFLVLIPHLYYITTLHHSPATTLIACIVCMLTIVCIVFVSMGNIRFEKKFVLCLMVVLLADSLQYTSSVANEDSFLRLVMHVRMALFMMYRHTTLSWRYE